MRRLPIALAAIVTLTLASPVFAAQESGRAPLGAKATTSKKSRGGAFLENPIEAMPEREEKPRQGWNGFYGGLNGGSAASDR